MKTVPLGGKKAHGRLALVDDGDYDLVSRYSWTVKEVIPETPTRAKVGPYAITGVRRGPRTQTILMHKLITGWPRTDHVNHDGLDNQRHNLRPATCGQNQWNRLPNAGHSSQYKGVFWERGAKKWRALIRTNGRQRHLGLFAAEIDAALAYDVAARVEHGIYAYLNFPG